MPNLGCYHPGQIVEQPVEFPMIWDAMTLMWPRCQMKVTTRVDGLVEDCSVSYTRVYKTSAGCLRSICLVHPGVRDKRRVSEIDLSQPRHETAFWWRHNGPATSQLTDPIKWRNYPLQLIGI